MMADMTAATGTPPVAISPIGDVGADFEFRAQLAEPDPDDPIVSVTVEVQALDGAAIWDTDAARSPDWPKGGSLVPAPGVPGLPVGVDLRWRERSATRSGVVGPWSDWTTFRLTTGGPTVEAVPVGMVATLVGAHLQATVALPSETGSLAGYEVQLAKRAPADSASWDPPLWSATGAPAAPADPLPWFDSLDGCPATQGMVIDSLRPKVRLSTADAIDAYSWRLTQHGHTVEEVTQERRPTTASAMTGAA